MLAEWRGEASRHFFKMRIFSKHAKLALTAAVFMSAGCSRRQDTRPDHPRLTGNVTMQDVVFASTSLERKVTYRAIVPATISNGKRLPVVYLLHGGGGDFREWSNDSDVSHFAENGLNSYHAGGRVVVLHEFSGPSKRPF